MKTIAYLMALTLSMVNLIPSLVPSEVGERWFPSPSGLIYVEYGPLAGSETPVVGAYSIISTGNCEKDLTEPPKFVNLRIDKDKCYQVDPEPVGYVTDPNTPEAEFHSLIGKTYYFRQGLEI